jgi:hypothetical protein
MEFDTGPRYSQNAALNYSHHYYYNDRNIPVANSNGLRPNPRGYPICGPVGGSRLRGSMSREEENMDSGQARRRIAVACARCRKRKIRCSGDPGDGTGCNSCKGAGVDVNVCQFHRVGSGDASRVLDSIVAHSLASLANPSPMMPLYNGSGLPLYSRPSYPQLDTKPAYPSTWTVPYQEETSPVETYNLDQANNYLPNQQSMATTGTYSGNYRWSNPQDPVSMYGTHNLPYAHSNARYTATSEALSPLNTGMASLQLSLPDRTYTRPTDHTAPQRQLPIPQPSPAQTSRNVVDQLQDQRLRSTHGRVFPKPGLPFHSDGEVQAVSTADSSGILASRNTASAPINTGDATIGYLPTTVGESNAGTQPPLNFGTSAFLDAMPAPAIPTTYSNFRNYDLPTSSSAEITSTTITRQGSQPNLYSFSPDQKRHSACDRSNESALVSGHRYMPLSQSQSRHQQQTSLEGLRRDSFSNRTVPVHRASTSNLSHAM